MKTKPIALSFALAVAVGGGATAQERGYVASARVVNSAPIIETVYEEVETCRYKRQSAAAAQRQNTQDKIIGGLIGGGVGSLAGKGSGKDAAAAIGAVVGGEVADGDGITEGEIIGGIAGGLIGNQIGKGSGKTAATAAGALIGAIVGDNIQAGNSAGATTAGRKVRVCSVEHEERKVITGYEVTLEYDGFVFDDVVSRRPGDYVDVHVGVRVLEDRTGSAQ